jgi:hypothetical protein
VWSRRFIGLGLLSVVPTAVTRLSDYQSLGHTSRKIGACHATINSAATLAYALLWLLSPRRYKAAVAVGFVGALAATYGAFLGGKLVFEPSDP